MSDYSTRESMMIKKNSNFYCFGFFLFFFIFLNHSHSQELISVYPNQQELIGQNETPKITADGRYIVFQSSVQIFKKDTLTGDLQFVSTTQNGEAGNRVSYNPSINQDGRFIVFESIATNFYPGASSEQIYLKDTVEQTLTLISKNKENISGNFYSNFPFISNSGEWIFFQSNSSNLILNGDRLYRVYAKNNSTQEMRMFSSNSNELPANAASFHPISDPLEQFIFFESSSTNLSKETKGYQIYRKNIKNNETILISTNDKGEVANGNCAHSSITPGGQEIAFSCNATNLVNGVSGNQIYYKNLLNQKIDLISADENKVIGNGFSSQPHLSMDGTKVTFMSGSTNWKNGAKDGFLHLYQKNRITGKLTYLKTNLNDNNFYPLIGSFDTDATGKWITYTLATPLGSQIWKTTVNE